MMIKILLTDDHVIVRDGIKTLLKSEKDLHVVAEASNGQEALNVLAKQEVDVVLMDINMPGIDGLKASELISSKYTSTKIIALTMYREMHMVEAMFKAGAKAYLLKSCSKEELISAIKGVYEGAEYLEENLREDFSSYLNKPISKGKPSCPSVSKRKKEYNAKETKRQMKAHIAAEIVRHIRGMNPSGRFLREDANGLWFDVGDAVSSERSVVWW